MQELDIRDKSFQREFPTVMVPRFSPLEPCPERKVRLLMARDGLYLESRQKWGHLITKLWDAPKDLPYGDVEEVDTFKAVLERLQGSSIMEEITEAAAEFARDGDGREWMGWIVFDQETGDLRYEPRSFEADKFEVRYDARKRGLVVAVDIHSHNTMQPEFSIDDDNDDSGGVRIAVVIGNFRESDAGVAFDFAYRYCVEGFKIYPERDYSDVFSESQEVC